MSATTASAPTPPESRDARVRPRSRRRWLLGPVGGALTLTFAALAASCGGSDASPAASDDGAALYAQNCASCHGDDLGGTDLGPSHLSVVYEPSHHGDDAFRAAIASGAVQHHWNFGNMPAIDGLDDSEVDAIIAYIRAEQEQRGFEPYER